MTNTEIREHHAIIVYISSVTCIFKIDKLILRKLLHRMVSLILNNVIHIFTIYLMTKTTSNLV